MDAKEIAMNLTLKLIDKANSHSPGEVGKNYQIILKAVKEAVKEAEKEKRE